MSVKVNEWLLSYREIVQQRLESGEIKPNTYADYLRLIEFCRKTWGNRVLSRISVSEVTRAIHQKAADAPHAARRLRINLSNLFLEAQREGTIRLGHNPALVSRYPPTSVKTGRLSLEEWKRIFRCAKYRTPDYFQSAMLLALVTAQRPSDIIRMKAADVHDGYLHITQFKTSEKIALPVALRLEAIATSLSEVLEICSPRGLLLQNNGREVNTWSLSRWFRLCREECGIADAEGKTAPPFREQRSLSERLYRGQGVDTMTLLGHKYQRMTDSYNDRRGKEYRKLDVG